MLLLPHKVGPVTLMRRLGTDGITESYVGILDDPAGKTVVARRIVPGVLRDPARAQALAGRVGDLLGIRHPALVPMLREVVADGEHLLLEDWTEALTLERIIQWCAKTGQTIPHNVFLNLAAQICNGLEALHSRPGPSSGAESVLHLALHPGSVWVGVEGKVLLGGFGLFRSPVTNAQNDSGGGTIRLEYMAPEQTHLDQKLGPPSDVFALGALLYEALTGKPMFRAESNLQTIHRIRRAEVTTHLLEVREAFPGLDRVLYRALSLNPRHRYQRAFVLREDLRGLMARFSFATITEDTRAFLSPIFVRTRGTDEATSDTPIGFPTTEPAQPREATPLPQTDTGILLLGSGVSSAAPRTATPLDAPQRLSLPMNPKVPSAATPAPAPVRSPAVAPESIPPMYGFGGTQGIMDEIPVHLSRGDELPLSSHGGPAEPNGETGWIERPPAADVTSWEVRSAAHSAVDFSRFDQEDINTGLTSNPSDTRTPAPASAAFGRESLREAPPTPRPELRQRGVSGPTIMPLDEPSSPRPLPPRGLTPPPALPQPHTVYGDADDGPSPARSSWLPIAAVGGAIGLGLVTLLVCGGTGALQLLRGSLPEGLEAAPQPTEVSAAQPADAAATEAPALPEREAVAAAEPVAAPAPAPALPREVEPRAVASVEPAPRVASVPEASPPRPPPPAPAQPVAANRTSQPVPVPIAAPVPVPIAAPVPAPPPAAVVIDSISLSEMGVRATRGQLLAGDRAALEALAPSDALFSRGYTLLYQDAKTRGDGPSRRAYLSQLMAVPESQYRPELLIESAQMSFDRRDWDGTIQWAQKAEQHWARLPSDLVFNRKALIYELQAGAWTNKFFASEGSDTTSLTNAIRSWEKYKTHVASQPSQGLTTRAEQQLAKLYDAQQRLQ